MRLVLISLLVLAATGCGGSAGGRHVVASFYPLAWAAEQIGGPQLHVRNLTPPGAEPHDIELSPREVGAIQTADVVLSLSRTFQPSVADAAKDARGTVVEVGSGLEDPHIWLDPLRFAAVVERVGAALGRPARGRALAARVRALDPLYRRGLAHCARREFVSTHAAFSYLAARYGLRMVAVTGIDPESEAAPRKIASLVALVRREHVRTVFFEPLASPRLARTVAREARVRTAVLDPIEGLTPAEQRAGADYLTLMRQNLRALRGALGCR